MPLLTGNDKGVIAENIRTLRGEGKSEDQSIAIAYEHAKRTKRKSMKRRKRVRK